MQVSIETASILDLRSNASVTGKSAEYEAVQQEKLKPQSVLPDGLKSVATWPHTWRLLLLGFVMHCLCCSAILKACTVPGLGDLVNAQCSTDCRLASQ